MGIPFMGGGSVSLNGVSDEQLRILSSQSGIAYELLKAQQRAEMASAGSSGDIGDERMIPTVEIQLKTNLKNPVKARKKNIKMLREITPILTLAMNEQDYHLVTSIGLTRIQVTQTNLTLAHTVITVMR